ncbi:MAG: hypothetical protein P8Y47_03805 [Alphaproteobacteria bacterium]
MTWASVRLVPGVNTSLTSTDLQAGYTRTNLGRFKDGRFQKIGGWTKYYDALLGDTPRALHAYQDLSGNDRVVIGSAASLYDLTDDVLNDITPQRTTTSVTADFSTTSGSSTVTIVDDEVGTVDKYSSVTFLTPVAVGGLILHGTYQIDANVSATSYTIIAADNATSTVNSGGAVPQFDTTASDSTVTVTLTAHGLSAGDEVVFDISTTVGGVTIYGRYTVQSAPTANTFTITAENSASSTTSADMNSGEASFTYDISMGPQVAGAGYGTGTYGTGTYGYGAAATTAEGTPISSVADWSLSNWSELLIASPEDGGVYWWGAGYGYQNTQLVSDAPIYNTGTFVSISEQVVFSYGSTVDTAVGAYHDPLLVRWCETGNFFTWPALKSFRIPHGSKCVGGAATPQRNLIWTDIALWSATYIGTLGYGFREIGSNCGLIAKHAQAQLGGNVYWMGPKNFYVLGATVGAIPCPVWDAVFQDLNPDYAHLCCAGSNTAFSEVFFFYPSASSTYCDKYAKLNTMTGEWDIGDLQRNAWLDQTVLSKPIAITNKGLIYSHEDGNNADASPINASFTTGYFFIDEGRELLFVDRVIPDFKWGEFGGSQNATIKVTIYAVKWPGETPTEYGPYEVTASTQTINKRFRARQMALKIESDDVDSFWRLGLVRFRYSQDGRR